MKPFNSARRSRSARPPRGYTLVEILVATALALLLMAVTVQLFGSVTEDVADHRSIIETADRLRETQRILQTDLRYVTVKPIPPVSPETGEGYLEIREGAGPSFEISSGIIARRFGIQPRNSDAAANATSTLDTSVGDVDDVLMFTTRSYGAPFVGRWGNSSVESQVAEVSWFLRGTTLYRRVLLVLPREPIPTGFYSNAGTSYYERSDVSVHQEGGPYETDLGIGQSASDVRLVANSLGDLTKRENRYAHQPYVFPHDVRPWGALGLPTLRECSSPNWPFPYYKTQPVYNNRRQFVWPQNAPITPASQYPSNGIVQFPTAQTTFDYWTTPYGFSPANVNQTDGTLNGYQGPRIAEDVILTNVIGFDVKVWDPNAPVFLDNSTGQAMGPGDPGYRNQLARWFGNNVNPISFGAYVDLFYARGISPPRGGYPTAFAGPGNTRSPLRALNANQPAVYDTWSTHYETDGIDQDGDNLTDEGFDGIDNDNRNGVDDLGERETQPPYAAPLRSIQIKIRVFERDSRQIREVTVVQDFLS